MKKILLATMLLLAVGGSLMAKSNVSLHEMKTVKLDFVPGTVTAVDSVGLTTTGPIIAGLDIPVGAEIAYSGGDGGDVPLQIHASSVDLPGLELFIEEQPLANGTGVLKALVTGAAAHAGTAKFTITIGGQSYDVFFEVM